MTHLLNNIQRQGLRFTLCAVMMASATAASAQEAEEASAPVRKVEVSKYPTVVLHGNIIDLGTKAPLAGVQLQTLGNNKYTAMTDEDGNFTIKVPKFATSLYVSTPQYLSQQVAINVNDTVSAIHIRMISDNYSAMYDNGTNITASKKATLDSHSLSVDGDIVNDLQGDVRAITRSGVVENGASFFVRGLGSLNANAQPLIVIDGIEQDMMLDRVSLHEGQFMNMLSNISTADIESVEVLKNATALYGARGANGVILIKTKRGHSMATRIDADVFMGYLLVPSSPNMMNAAQYRTFATEMLGTVPALKEYGKSIAFNFLNDDPTGYYYNTYHNDTKWSDYAYRNALTQNYNINVQGGDAVGMYNLSLGYMKAQNTGKESDFDRMNIRFNTDIEVFKNVNTRFDLSISRTNSNVFDTAISPDLTQGTITSPTFLSLIKSPLVAPYEYNAIIKDYSHILCGADDIFSQLNSVENGLGRAQSLANPVSILTYGKGDNKNKAENTFFNVVLAPEWKINSHLKVGETISYNLIRNSQRYLRPFTGVPSFTISDLGTVYSKVSSFQAKENNIVSNTRIDWENMYGSHTVKAYGGFRYNMFSYSSTELATEHTTQTDDKNPTLSASSGYPTSYGASDAWKQIQWYANVDYNYQNKYFLTASFLGEANSRFGANAGTKIAGVGWAFFPSIQAGWILTNEKWFKKSRGINYLRLSAGFDTSGNDGISNYAARTAYQAVRYNYNAIGSQLTNIGNDKIKWELTKKFNVGLDGKFVDNRIALGVNYFVHNTSDLLTLKTFDNPIGGINFYWTNGGSLRNEGFDASISVKPVVTKDWHLELGATVGHYKNKITSLPDGDYTSSIYGDNNILTSVGNAAGLFYGYKTEGIFSTTEEAQKANLYMEDKAGIKNYYKAGDVHFTDQNGDGKINAADKVVIGDPNPDIYGNIFASLNYKRVTLNLNFTYSLGNDIYNYQRSILNSGSNFYNQQVAEISHWRYEGQEATLPRLSYGDPLGNNRFSDRWIEDGSYLRLKNVRINYSIPVPSSSTWLQGLSVWAEARNVFTVTKYLGADPEFSIGNSVLYQGIDAGNIAQGRSFLVGVKINL